MLTKILDTSERFLKHGVKELPIALEYVLELIQSYQNNALNIFTVIKHELLRVKDSIGLQNILESDTEAAFSSGKTNISC
ncbi:hypothetical protein EON65_27945 [archaeon]|nr:MAG: hypothetical protein EON65_27945 [archaeon]